MNPATIPSTVSEVLTHLRDADVAMQRAGLVLLTRLPENDLYLVIPEVLSLGGAEDRNALSNHEIASAFTRVARPECVRPLISQLGLETPAGRLVMVLEILLSLFPAPNHYRRHEPKVSLSADLITAEDVQRVVALLRHPKSEDVRMAAAHLCSSPTFARYAGDAAATLILWFTDHSRNQTWFHAASEALVAIGAPAVDPLIRGLQDPSGIVREAWGPSEPPDWTVAVVRDRAASVLGAMKTIAAKAAPVLLDILPQVPPTTRYQVSMAITATGAGNVLLARRINDALNDVDDACRLSLYDYFSTVGAAGVSALVPALATKRATSVLAHYLTIGVADPDALLPAIAEVEKMVTDEPSEATIRAAWVLATQGPRLHTLAPTMEEKLDRLVMKMREGAEHALDLAILLLVQDVIKTGNRQALEGIAGHVTWTKRSAA